MADQLMVILKTMPEFDAERFSDLVIKFSGRERKIHRIVMYLASEWFRTALTGSFAEADATSIEVHGDNPDALNHMISLCYLDVTAQVDHMKTQLPEKQILTVSLSTMLVADKYGCRGVLSFIQKYADDRIKAYRSDAADTEDLFKAVDICFSHSIPSFDLLRKSMLEIMQSNLVAWYNNVDETGYKAFMAQVSKHGAIGAALIADLNPTVTRPRPGYYRCTTLRCKKGFVLLHLERSTQMTHYCPYCGSYITR